MSGTPPEPLKASPIELHGARAQNAARDAAIWIGLAAAVWLIWKLMPVILLIIGGLVFAAGLQGGERLLARVWKAPHALRMSVVIIVFLLLLAAFILFAGMQLAAQFEQLQATLTVQLASLRDLAHRHGVQLGSAETDPMAAVQSQLFGSIGSFTTALGSVAGGLGSVLFMMMFGIYIALDPRIYERGIEWLTPAHQRVAMAATITAMARTLRRWVAGRLLAMVIEGIVIGIALWLAGVPLAGLLGLVAGLLAFIPTLGALIAGTIIVAVGFSAGTTQGVWAFLIYLGVQFIEGNILTPLIEKRVVDLAPATVLAAQLLFGVLFGILGVALADPIVAMTKVALGQRGAAAK